MAGGSETASPSLPPAVSLCRSRPHPRRTCALSRGRRARNRQMKWEFMPPLSGPPLPSPPLYSALRPFGSHSLPHSLTHHPKLALLLHHAGHRDGGAGVGAHHRVVRSEEVHVAAGTAFQSGGAAQKHRRRPGSNHGVRNGAAIRP